jgi:6-phospho-3-hexuloisomerase
MGTLKTIMSEIEHVLNEMEETQIDTFADRLLAPPRVFVTGEGRSGLMAKAFAMRLMQLGLTVYVVGETTTPALKEKDALVAVSGSGTTEGTVHVARRAKDAGCTLFAVTTKQDALLATLAAHTLIIPAATKWRRVGESSTTQPLGSLFDQCCHIALDAVCLHIAERNEISNKAARELHTNLE